MEQANGTATNGNGAAVTKVKEPTCLDKAKEIFASRKAPASTTDVTKALKEYMSIQDEMDKLTEQAEALKVKRTAATQKLVELRGSTRVNSKTRGVGNVMARSDSAWLSFIATTDSEEIQA